MNFDWMEYYCVLAEEKNFTKAAARLHITQQSLSAAVASLEEKLGCKLFERGKPLQLTYAGKVFLRYAKECCNTMYSMRHEFDDISKHIRGELHVGIAQIRGLVILPDIVKEFNRKWPQIKVHFFDGANLNERILERELDLAVTHFIINAPMLEYKEFYKEKMVLVAAHSLLDEYRIDPVRLREELLLENPERLRDCPFVLSSPKGFYTNLGMELFRKNKIEPNVSIRCNNVGALLKLAARGVGVTFATSNTIPVMLSDAERSEILVFDLPDSYTYSVRFAYNKNSYQWSIIKEFMNVASEVMNRKTDESAESGRLEKL